MVQMRTLSPGDLLGADKLFAGRALLGWRSENRGWNTGAAVAGKASEQVQWLLAAHGERSHATETMGHIDGKLYGGVTNVGVKPTVGSDGPLAETYILDFSGDLYGKTVEVYFFRFVRPERRFESIDRLREQIAADKCSVQEEVAQNIEQMLFVDSLVQPD